jgi:hypothetical protein
MILMNAEYFKENLPENTVPPWLLPCKCSTQRCQCYSRVRPNPKIAKYQPLIHDIQTLGWNVAPLIVISTGVRRATYNPSIKTLQTTYKFKRIVLKDTLINIKIIATEHLTSIILHKS